MSICIKGGGRETSNQSRARHIEHEHSGPDQSFIPFLNSEMGSQFVKCTGNRFHTCGPYYSKESSPYVVVRFDGWINLFLSVIQWGLSDFTDISDRFSGDDPVQNISTSNNFTAQGSEGFIISIFQNDIIAGYLVPENKSECLFLNFFNHIKTFSAGKNKVGSNSNLRQETEVWIYYLPTGKIDQPCQAMQSNWLFTNGKINVYFHEHYSQCDNLFPWQPHGKESQPLYFHNNYQIQMYTNVHNYWDPEGDWRQTRA